MAGFIQIVIYMLCVYLILKGVEIFQIGIANNTGARKMAVTIGVLSLLGAVGAAVAFFIFEEMYAADFGSRTNDLRNLGR